MFVYECSNEKCDWKGDKEEVNWMNIYAFDGVEEPEDDEDFQGELICVCPKCEKPTLAYEKKI